VKEVGDLNEKERPRHTDYSQARWYLYGPERLLLKVLNACEPVHHKPKRRKLTRAKAERRLHPLQLPLQRVRNPAPSAAAVRYLVANGQQARESGADSQVELLARVDGL
jgi:hypothetical protein